MKEKGDYTHMKKHDLYAVTKETLKEAFDLFLRKPEFLCLSTKH